MDMDFSNERCHTFTWIIENFSSCTQENGASIKSPVFTAQSLHYSQWYLSLYPRGVIDGKGDCISCYLHRNEKDQARSRLKCKFVIEMALKDNKQLVSCEYNEYIFKNNTSWGSNDFMKRDVLLTKSAHLSDDILSIKCLVTEILPKTVLASESVVSTCIGVDRNSFTWISTDINNPCYRQEIIKKVPYLDTKFILSVRILKGDIAISIRRDSAFSNSIWMSCKITFLDTEGEEQDSKQASHLFEASNHIPYKIWEFPVFMQKSKLNDEKNIYLKNGCFTLKCDISFSSGMYMTCFKEHLPKLIKHKDSCSEEEALIDLQNDLERLYILKLKSDVALRAEDKVFPAHKCILISRSPVFLAMFDCSSVENQTEIVDIPNVDVETLKLFLEYMYTGYLKKLDDEIAMHLLVVADKYKVLHLIDICSDFLSCAINYKNIFDILFLSDLTENEMLRESVVIYIKKNPKIVFMSDFWKHYVETSPKLASDIILKISI